MNGPNDYSDEAETGYLADMDADSRQAYREDMEGDPWGEEQWPEEEDDTDPQEFK
jgi:hypothetical protein